MNKTSIEYLDYSWNPFAMRCTPIGPGCAHCWHLRMAKRLAANWTISPEARPAYAGEKPPTLINQRITEPLEKKKPAVVGVQFMGDLYHADILPISIISVYGIMHVAVQHTFVVLTKRPERIIPVLYEGRHWYLHEGEHISNIWHLTSVENQAAADQRIPELLKLRDHGWPVLGISAEPLLGYIDVRGYLGNGLNWVIAGAETGPNARPMDLDWARSLRDQCREAEVPFFFKRASDGARELDDQRYEERPCTYQ